MLKINKKQLCYKIKFGNYNRKKCIMRKVDLINKRLNKLKVVQYLNPRKTVQFVFKALKKVKKLKNCHVVIFFIKNVQNLGYRKVFNVLIVDLMLKNIQTKNKILLNNNDKKIILKMCFQQQLFTVYQSKYLITIQILNNRLNFFFQLFLNNLKNITVYVIKI